jgi:hypothetical protein
MMRSDLLLKGINNEVYIMISFKGIKAYVELRNPDQGDISTFSGHTKFKRDYSGALHSTKNLPITRGFSLKFRNLTKTEQINFMNFLRLTAGEIVVYKDYDNTNWNVKITNDPISFKINATGISQEVLEETEPNDLEIELEVIA